MRYEILDGMPIEDRSSPSRLCTDRTLSELFLSLVFRIPGLLCPLGKCNEYKSENHQALEPGLKGQEMLSASKL